MANYKGIDVSKYQGSIDFNKVKAQGYTFVIIKAGYGKYSTQVDPYFEENYKRAKAAGLNVGAYWFGYATTVADAKKEANVCMQAIKGKKFEYPIYYDMETDTTSNHYPFSTGIVNCSAMVEAFCDLLEKSGYFAGLYISRSPLQAYITPAVANRYALWVADYNDKCYYNGSFGIWQYSEKGRVSGINANVDMDISYIDYATIIKNKGLNGFSKTAAKTTTAKPNTTKNDTVASRYDAFEKKYLGKAVDYDGVAGVQCVDLVDQYLKECYGITGVWVNGARDLYNNFNSYPALKAKFTKVPNTRELIVKKGDIVVWGGGSWGHTGIGNGKGDIDTFESLEENTLGQHEPTQIIKHYFNGTGGSDGCNPVLGVLRPNKIK